jgi:hypothetical protein
MRLIRPHMPGSWKGSGPFVVRDSYLDGLRLTPGKVGITYTVEPGGGFSLDGFYGRRPEETKVGARA